MSLICVPPPPQRLIFEVDWLPKIENCSDFKQKNSWGVGMYVLNWPKNTVIKNKIYRIQFLFFSIMHVHWIL